MLSILKEVGIGSYYIKIGLVLRDAILKSKLLLNSDVWHNLTLKEISALEEVDKNYLRSILRSHSKVANECIFFEVGLLPLKYEIIKKS